MRIFRVLLPVLVFCIMAFAPHQAYAATATFFGPIIPPECHCDADTNGGVQSAPDFGCTLAVVGNLMNFAISIGVIIFVMVCAYAGLLWMFSPMNPHNRELGRSILLNAVIGLLLTLAAWLLVDFLMKTLYNPETQAGGTAFGPWNSILGDGNQCLSVITPAPGPTPTGGGLTAGTATGPDDDKDADGIKNSEDPDDDGDGVPDATDNCPFVANANQADADHDGKGDACETATGTGTGTGANCPVPSESSMAAFPAEASARSNVKGTPTTVQNFMTMRAAALQDGIDLKVVSGYRSDADQVAEWNSHNCNSGTCSSPVAKPCSLGGGGSNHNSGQAVDINNGCSPGSSSCNTSAYNWLKAHGAQYGFRNAVANDLVHWSPSGH